MKCSSRLGGSKLHPRVGWYGILWILLPKCSDLWEKIVLVIEKNFWNSRLKAQNLQNLNNFFLIVGQNNFGNKIPLIPFPVHTIRMKIHHELFQLLDIPNFFYKYAKLSNHLFWVCSLDLVLTWSGFVSCINKLLLGSLR